MGVSPYPGCAMCNHLPINTNDLETTCTVSESTCLCESGSMNGELPFQGGAAGSWSWYGAWQGGVQEEHPGECLLCYQDPFYYYAGPGVQLQCIQSGDDCGKWKVNLDYYLLESLGFCQFYGPSFKSVVLSHDFFEVTAAGTLKSKEPLHVTLENPAGSCEITLTWTGP